MIHDVSARKTAKWCSSTASATPRKQKPASRKPSLETLEDRLVPAATPITSLSQITGPGNYVLTADDVAQETLNVSNVTVDGAGHYLTSANLNGSNIVLENFNVGLNLFANGSSITIDHVSEFATAWISGNDVLWENSTLQGGMVIGGSSVTIDHNNISGGGSFEIVSIYSSNVTLSNNVITGRGLGNSYGDFSDGEDDEVVTFGQLSNLSFVNNTISGSFDCGIEGAGTWDHCTFTGNQFHDIGFAAIGGWYGPNMAYPDFGFTNCTFQNNHAGQNIGAFGPPPRGGLFVFQPGSWGVNDDATATAIWGGDGSNGALSYGNTFSGDTVGDDLTLLTPQALTVNENSTGSGNVLTGAVDAEGTAITAVPGTYRTAHGSVTINTDGTYTYTPYAGYVGSDSFAFAAQTEDETSSGTVNVTVNAVDDLTVTPQSLTINENSSGNGNVLNGAVDSEGAAITAVAGTFATTNGSVTIAADGSYTYTPNVGFSGSDSFAFTAQTADDNTSGTVNVTVNGVTTATANFVKADTTTQGNWFGAYGADGYDVSQDPYVNIPSYAQVSFSNQSDYTWASSTSDGRALEKPENLSDRIAGTWYTNGVSSFTIDVNLTDGNTHQVALYALDWDSGNRAETIKVLDAGTGTVLDTQTLAAGSFVNGDYLVWNIKGHVQIEVDYNGGYNAVVSGLFFGVGNTPAAPANLAATAGNGQVSLSWSAAGGATGYNVYRRTGSSGDTQIASGVDGTSFTDSSVSNGTTYSYEVTAVDAEGESGFSNEVSATPAGVQVTPTITWATPAAITLGTPLSATQLDATANVAGTFAYTPAAGTVLGVGVQTLGVRFTPTDTVDYTTATASVTLTVNPVSTALFGTSIDVAAGNTPDSAGTLRLDNGTELVLVANYSGNNVSVLKSNGDGTFASLGTLATDVGPNGFAVGDFGNGHQDFAIANYMSNTVSVFLGDGAGNFTLAATLATGSGPANEIAIGDFNGDGNLDLVTANQNDGTVSVFMGNGDGTFQSAVNYSVGAGSDAIVAGDFRGTGQLDLAVANYNNSTVTILQNQGNGSFTVGNAIAVGANPWYIASGDFNGDGKDDLATGNFGGGNVSVLISNGDGTFQSAVNHAAGANLTGIVVGDFNGDGKLDLATSNFGSNNASVLLGNGDGTFQAAQNFAVGSAPNGLATADLNGDGKLDLVVADQNGNAVSVLLNQSSAVPQTSAGPLYSATPVNLTGAFNRTGIITDGSTFGGGFDRDGFALSANLLGSSVRWNGNTFNLGAPNTNNVISAVGQTINLPAGNFSTLNFLAAGVNGNQPNLTFTVTYTDGTTQTFTQSVSDWYTPQGYNSESQAVTMSYRNLNNGGRDGRMFYVYGYSLALDSGKTVQSITLPNDGNVEILAMTLGS
jgi:hypothetical protein